MLELSPAAAAAHPDPYSTVELRAEFRSPNMRTYLMPAFWDGGRRMVLRFAPTEAGRWEYRIAGNIAEWDGIKGEFTAVASDAPGFLKTANVHHWATANNRPHLWMGASEMRLAWIDDADFRALVDARAAQKFNHLRGLVLGEGAELGFLGPGRPDLAHFQRLDQRVAYINTKGLVADLVLAPSPAALLRLLPDPAARHRFLRFLVGRYAARNVTWQGLEEFESAAGARALLAEVGGLLKQLDPYQHPRTTGARVTSAPLLDDGWMDFAAYGTADAAVGAIEHQLYQVPAVVLAREGGAGPRPANGAVGADSDANAEFRRRLWTASMNGQYPTYAGDAARNTGSPGAKAMTVWFDLMSAARYWDLEPYFDLDGGRALALPGVDYIVYIDKPGPIELTVERHGYDVYWMDPADGSTTVRRKWSGQHFTGEPPDRFHDWVLRLKRESKIEGMNRSYKFESREVPVQEIVIDPAKVPYEIAQPSGALAGGRAVHFAVKVSHPTRASRTMLWMWTAEISAAGEGYRVLGTAPEGDFTLPANLAAYYPTTALLRLYAINGFGTVYMMAKGFDCNQ